MWDIHSQFWGYQNQSFDKNHINYEISSQYFDRENP